MTFGKRLLAAFLVVLTLLGTIPLDGINIAEAGSGISIGETGSIGTGGVKNQQGGIRKPDNDRYYAGFRVAVMREPDMYMDGTPETRNNVIKAYGTKYPDIDTYISSLIFSPHNLISEGHNYNSATIGVGLYNRSNHSLDWTVNTKTDNMVARLTGFSSVSVANGHTLNKGKIALQNAGYLTADGKGKLMDDLKDGGWQQYMSSISYNDAIAIWNHIFTYQSGYDVTGRLDKVISQYYTSKDTNLQELPAAQKHDMTAGYIGVLMSLYRVALDRGVTESAATYSKAIEDYVTSSDITNKPVVIVIDTAVPVSATTNWGNRYFYVPSYDYMEYYALIPGDASMVASKGSAVLIGDNDGVRLPNAHTKNQLLAGANASLKRWPFSTTRDGNGEIRHSDGVYTKGTGTEHQYNIYRTAIGWGASVPGFPRERIITRASGASWGSSISDAGFINMVTFDNNIKGFTITTVNLVEEETKVVYKVDSTLQEMQENNGVAKPVYPNKISLAIKAQSSLLSTVESAVKNGTDMKMIVEAKVNRETYLQGATTPIEPKKEIKDLSDEISGEYNSTDLIHLLQGHERVLPDASVLTDSFEMRENENLTVKYVYYLDMKIKIGTFEREYGWEDIVFRIEDVPQNFAEHIVDPITITITPGERIVVPDPDPETPPTEDWEESVMVNSYVYSTVDAKQFAELKNNKIGNEQYEAMAGVPSTEEIYFSAGGTEYMLSMVLQYWINETGIERTYRSHFSGTACQFKEADNAKTASLGGQTAQLHTGSTHSKDFNFTCTVTEGSYSDHNNYTPAEVSDNERQTAYDDAVAFAEEVNATTITYTDGSSNFTRSQTGWSAKVNGSHSHVSSSYNACFNVCVGHPGSDSEGNPIVETCSDHECGHTSGSYIPAGSCTGTYTVTWNVPAHILCGPCCTHDLPAVEDTWKQGIFYDYAKISQLRLYKIDQASVTGKDLQELTGMEEIFASIKQGDPTYFMNIAQLSSKSPLQPYIKGTTMENIVGHSNTMYGPSDRIPSVNNGLNVSKYNMPSESSKFGRFRYSLHPEQHDVVVWNEGTRTNTCDGLAATKNNSADVHKVVAGNGHGEDQEWAKGILYTNSSYSYMYDFHMQKDGLKNKTGYSALADDRDIATPEWETFDMRRRTQNVATVISDFLILQTSGGDQSIFYFAKDSESVETQQYFPYVEADEDEMFTNNPDSVFNKVENGKTSLKDNILINIGGYNGKYKEPTRKHEPVNANTNQVLGVRSKKVTTVLDNDPAGTITRPASTEKMLMYQDGIKIKTTTPNKVYTPDDASVFYKQMAGYFSIDYNRKAAATGEHAKVISQLSLGLESKSKVDENLSKWGDQIGLAYHTSYSQDTVDRINSVIVFSPVSTEYATVLPLSETKPLIVNGVEISRDQRYDGDRIPDLNEQINKVKICPLDPGLCEFRTLNCKYGQDNLLAQFDFEPTYKTQERKTVGNKVELVDVTKQNTYQSGSSWITTNKVTGIEYVLPSGFTIGSGKVGSGKHLNAFGTRWSIPFSDLGITNDKNNVVSVKMDFFTDSKPGWTPMLVSFYRYDFYLSPNDGSQAGIFNTGNGNTGEKGAGVVNGNMYNRKVTVELDFSFNNVMDSKAKINGVPVNVSVRSTKPVWENVGGIRKQSNQTVALNRSTPDTIANTMPENLTKDYIGNTINIGSWGASSAYGAHYYLDNFEIWLKGGTHEHNSTCYTNIVKHETGMIHVHDENCYTKSDVYTSCTGIKNSNYQHGTSNPINYYVHTDASPINYYELGCNNLPLNTGGTTYCFSGSSGSNYQASNCSNAYCHYDRRLNCTIHDNLCNGTWECMGHSTPQTHTHTGSAGTTRNGCYTKGVHRHTGSAGTTANGCYTKGEHRHSGTAGTDSPNGCYTRATEHKHTSACGHIPANTLNCTGELNTESDYNTHIHTSACLTTATTLPTQTYNYTGKAQTFVVPATGEYIIKAWGASGGGTKDKNVASAAGFGGYTEGKITLTKGERLYIFVGGEGQRATALNTGGGWNGGGHGGPSGYGGGGATDIRTYNGSFNDMRSLVSRFMVAAGGGGADNSGGTLGGADDGKGGDGGNLTGENAKINGTYSANTGGTQTSGNAFGIGANATSSTDTGGGGGGYYGGRTTNNGNGGGGGGSSFISGHSGANAVKFDLTEDGKMENFGHSGTNKHYTGKVFSNTKVERGVHIGNGRVEIIPINIPANTLLTDIVNGDIPLNEMEDYLGQELMGKLWGSEKLMFTWSNWSASNMKGFNPNTTGIGSTISAVSNNLRIVQNTGNWELKVPVDIPSGLISKIELVIDNGTSATSGVIAGSGAINTIPNSASRASFTMAANTNNQTITIKPNSNWIETIKALWFDIGSGARYTGTMTVKAIRLYGYGKAVDGTGEVHTVTIKTPEQITEQTTVPKYVKKTTTTLITNGVAGTPSVVEEEVTAMGSPSTTNTTISTRTKLVSNGEKWTYSSVGSYTKSLPKGQYKLEVWGAQGSSGSLRGGYGGYSYGTYNVTAASQTLNIYIGGTVGTNGGGTGGGANGGGATDIRTSSTLASRLIVAGGGGGGGRDNGGYGGDGGGGTSNGIAGQSSSWAGGGTGGTQSSGGSGGSGYSSEANGQSGSLGQGGRGGTTNTRGGSGGGGYYGGGGGGSDLSDLGASRQGSGGGGGGSGYVSTTLTSRGGTTGTRSGNGMAVITSLQDIYSGDDVVRRVAITYYETTKTTSTPKTVVKDTSKTLYEPLKINFVSTQTDFAQFGQHTFTAPTTGWYAFEGWGASGSYTNNVTSGRGGYTYGEILLTKGETVYVYVGERGTGASYDYPVYTFNGGGYGGTPGAPSGKGTSAVTHDIYGGRGGGATDFRLNSGAWDNVTGLRSRIMVAGGGGGRGCASSHLINGDAGGFVGFDTLNGHASYYGYVSKGGTQTSGVAGHRNGTPQTGTYTKAGEFGKGAIKVQCAAGGGGGYYGGGATYTAGGAGGSSFISGMTGMNAVNSNGTHRNNPTHYSGKVFRNPLMRAGNEVMPKPNGGIQTGHDGNGYARISFIPTKPQGEPIRQTILDNVSIIPEFLRNGEPNPLFLCRGLPFNAHVCTENCITIALLNCTEPHHSGEHYDSSSKICWEPCGDDHKHAIVPPTVEVEPGRFVQNADFLQLDEEFTVYFPNRGDFAGNNALGLNRLQAQTGKGYSNNMNTLKWTREKRIRFSFDVLYDNGSGVHMYKAGHWIELEVPKEYFDFYIPVAVPEASNATVEFEVEAINNGVAEVPSLNFPNTITTTYRNALNTFKTGLRSQWLSAIRSGYSDHKSSNWGYRSYFTWKRGRENVLSNAVATTKNIINTQFPIINERAKPLTVNDNHSMMSNRKRSSSLEHLHGGTKYFHLDLIGRIGNFAIVDSEDFRFSNFFKLPITDPPEWLIEGFVYKVYEGIQNNYLGDPYDIRGNKINENTRWLNTYGTQEWMQGTFESDRDVREPNIITQILSDDVNNITQLKGEQLRYGYDVYTTMSTYGNYQTGNVLVTPYYYALNLKTGEIKPIDVYISKDGVYEPVNIFDNAVNGIPKEPVYEYVLNLDWRAESLRRNYTLQEKTDTEKVAEYKKTILYDYSGFDENNPPGIDYELPIIGEIAYEVPSGAYNYLGTAQSLVLNPKHRTFAGSEVTNGYPNEMSKWGTNKNPDGLLLNVDYQAAVQRWHYKLGIPSSSVFVEEGDAPKQEFIEKIMNPDHVILSTTSVIAQGTLWTLEYTQPWVSSIAINGKNYNVTSDIHGVGIPPIVAVYSSDNSSVLDIDVIKTH